MGSSGEATFNFEGESLHAVVKVILGDLLRQNYVIAPNVQGTVTLATPRPVSDAQALSLLEMVLGWNNARLIWSDGRYNIVLSGSNRFRIIAETDLGTPYRNADVDLVARTLDELGLGQGVGEDELLRRPLGRLLDLCRDRPEVVPGPAAAGECTRFGARRRGRGAHQRRRRDLL